MAHNYAKDPPRFAIDPVAWDYTRDKLEESTGLPYDQWTGRQFAAAQVIYRNVRAKYGDSLKEKALSIPHPCVACGERKPHYEGDYICQSCRDAIEDSESYYEAAETITRPDAMDDIREKLAEKLGQKNVPAAMPVDSATSNVMEKTAPASTGTVSRNYGAMGDDKLLRSIQELEDGRGEAFAKAEIKGEDPLDHLESALRVAQEKGLLR